MREERLHIKGFAGGRSEQSGGLHFFEGGSVVWDRLKLGDRAVAVGDEDGFAAAHLLEQMAELILGRGYAGSFHMAKLAKFLGWGQVGCLRSGWVGLPFNDVSYKRGLRGTPGMAEQGVRSAK